MGKVSWIRRMSGLVLEIALVVCYTLPRPAGAQITSFTASLSEDWYPAVRGPHPVVLNSNGSNCVKIGYNGSSSNIGGAIGFGVGNWNFGIRYSDFSSALNDIDFEFRT